MANLDYVLEPEVFGPLDIDDIMKALPHRFPFLLVDRVIEVRSGRDESGNLSKVGTEIRAIKNVSVNEPHFVGHFPNWPIKPGVLIIECMAQTAAFSFYQEMMREIEKESTSYAEVLLLGVDRARFRRPVRPGDQLEIHSKVIKIKKNMISHHVKVSVDGKLVAEADLLSALSFKTRVS